MHPPGASTVLVRYGDLTTKSESVGKRMRDKLAAHCRSLLAARDLEADLDLRHARAFIETDPEQVEAVARAAADVFGVSSVSVARAVEPTLAAIETALADAAREHYTEGSFAVDARRATDTHHFTSEDVEEGGGAAVWEAVDADPAGPDPEVDLEDPDIVFAVEVRPDAAYVMLDRIAGPGGFPLGSQAPLVALVSGGIDSPVAAYEAMARGSPLVPVYLDLGDFGGPDHEARAMETVRHLAWYAPGEDWTLHRVPAGESVRRLADALDRGRMLAFRRYMFAVAEAIAEEHDAAGIVTGEALGQKSSQTARNLAVTSAATELPIHRPLLAWDKHEIAQRAREIGTYSDATIPAGCNRFAPDSPETGASLEWVRDVEPDGLFEWAWADAAAAEGVTVDPSEPDR